MVFGVREPGGKDELDGLPELAVAGLRADDARLLLDAALPGPIDERVQDRILGETGGNPLALIELPRGLTPAELAGGFGLLDARPLDQPHRAHASCSACEALPRDSRLLLLTAAAEPLGDLSLLWRAAERLGIGGDAGRPAEAAGLIELGTRVRFPHPLVRSAVYRARRHRATGATSHRALADSTDPVARSRPSRLASRARDGRRRTRRSPPRWRTRPIVRSAVAAWRRPPRSSSARPS